MRGFRPEKTIALAAVAVASMAMAAPANAAEFALVQAEALQTAKATVLQGFGELPLIFEPNQGQTDERVKFLSRGRNH